MPMLDSFIDGLARLETAGGRKTIKGPNGQDSFNLFNIKDFSGKGGFNAYDKAEGSRDAYRAYTSYDESKEDLKRLLARKYPGAFNASTPEEFATELKKGGYATDPNYVSKLTSVIKSGGEKAPSSFDPSKMSDAELDAALAGSEAPAEKKGAGARFIEGAKKGFSGKGLVDNLAGVPEAGLALASGAVAPTLATIGEALSPKYEGGDRRQNYQDTKNAFTYEPRSKTGKNIVGAIDWAATPVAKVAQAGGRKYGEVIGDELAGDQMGDALGMAIGAKGVKAASKVAGGAVDTAAAGARKVGGLVLDNKYAKSRIGKFATSVEGNLVGAGLNAMYGNLPAAGGHLGAAAARAGYNKLTDLKSQGRTVSSAVGDAIPASVSELLTGDKLAGGRAAAGAGAGAIDAPFSTGFDPSKMSDAELDAALASVDSKEQNDTRQSMR